MTKLSAVLPQPGKFTPLNNTKKIYLEIKVVFKDINRKIDELKMKLERKTRKDTEWKFAITKAKCKTRENS